ncbi:MAG: hypothetical protein SGPRY_007672, partial [Prymnesium sp.]
MNPGVPVERAWAVTPTPESILPPAVNNMGRHGMTLRRFKKIRSVLSFGPRNEAALRVDTWGFTAEFREDVNTLAYALMHNPDQQITADKRKEAARRAAPNSSCVSSSRSDGLSHPLVKMTLKALPAHVGGKDGRQRCNICNKKRN